MSADKYPSILSRQMEAIVDLGCWFMWLCPQTPLGACAFGAREAPYGAKKTFTSGAFRSMSATLQNIWKPCILVSVYGKLCLQDSFADTLQTMSHRKEKFNLGTIPLPPLTSISFILYSKDLKYLSLWYDGLWYACVLGECLSCTTSSILYVVTVRSW